MHRRRQARLALLLSSIPGVFSVGAVSVGVEAESFHQAWLAFSAMLQAWWEERRELEARRKAFWLAYREDPWRLVPPTQEEGVRAPWE